MKRDQRGSALLIVLWACALLAVLVGSYALVARVEVLQARYQLAHARARDTAEAALIETIFSLLQAPDPAVPLRTDGAIRHLTREGMDVRISVRDERGKIDLNQAPAGLLQRWLMQAGVKDARNVAAALIAWRSPILTLGQRQRQDARYRAAGADYGPRGAPFASVEELGRIPGLGPATLKLMLPDATLWSGMAVPVPELASARVLAASTGLDPAAAGQAYLARISRPMAITAATAWGAVESVEVSAEARDGVRATLAATVRLQGWSADRAYTVLRWQEDGMP